MWKPSRKYEVIVDDRDVAAGIQFADADLLGVPVRIVVSKRNLDKGEFEISTRDKKMMMNVPIDEIGAKVDSLFKK